MCVHSALLCLSSPASCISKHARAPHLCPPVPCPDLTPVLIRHPASTAPRRRLHQPETSPTVSPISIYQHAAMLQRHPTTQVASGLVHVALLQPSRALRNQPYLHVCSFRTKVLRLWFLSLPIHYPRCCPAHTSTLLESRRSGSSTIPIQLDYKPPSPRCPCKTYQI